ncbi:MAG: replication factor C large subunit [Candidatus Pacearchaeota archaeon]
MSFVEKYKPKSLKEIKGQDTALIKLKEFVENFPNKRKTCILYGPPGCGKTASVYALANEKNAEVVELNASDFRDEKVISEVVGSASSQKSLFAKSKIILIDEVDGISGFYDKGGLIKLVRLIDLSCFPIIMTANHIWDKKFSDLRRLGELIEFKEINYNIIFEILKDVAKKENLKINENLLKSIAIKARGDVRAALNDLQVSDIGNYNIDERDKEENIFNVLKQVLKNRPSEHLLELYEKLDMNLDEVYLWLEENIPKEYKDEELARAIDLLSRADVFRGRIVRQQHWRFLIYQNFFLSYGVSASKKQAKTGFTNYKRPERLLKIWMINQKNLVKKEIAKKFARYCHISFKRAMQEFDFIKNILKNQEIQQKIGFEDKEVEYLKSL